MTDENDSDTTLTPSDLGLAWIVNDPDLGRYPWRLALADRRLVLLSDALEAVVLTNGRELYEPATKHDLSPAAVPGPVLAAAHTALRRHDADELVAILRRTRQIARFWGVADVQAVRPDLDAEQAWDVLQDIEWAGDPETPVTTGLIAEIADTLFPTPTPRERNPHD